MQSTITALIESRASINHFDPERKLADTQIKELVRLATLAPSAYNFQNWKFIAVRSQPAKERLKAVAYNQPKVAEAAVMFIVCGTLAAHEGLPRALQPSVEVGILAQSVADGWVAMASGAHQDNPQMQRDEALRSASLAAMTLMLAAQGMGLATCPMVGFDAEGVAREFNLSSNDVPVMLVAAGYAAPDNWPQKRRKPLQEVLELL
ncbi:nitroreductase family protein [Pseudoduganella ginsengisoli]|uniref:Nitroreductase family protein n=1 Tax=Pseudoduganella ginsengisoli TaxID=1462440 RepID=A0A6L6Q565_9BURK|nr:nitroreductase family protein [Pseudoduganella ginsengisoli]MTW04418.1 nitroreductase family protein [Pseudoduganella ginsengisoli]